MRRAPAYPPDRHALAWEVQRLRRKAIKSRANKEHPPAEEHAVGKRYPLEHGHIIKFANRRCKTCYGRGFFSVSRAEIKRERKGVTRSKPGPFKTELCACGLKRVMDVPGVHVDPLTGVLYLTVPPELHEGFPAPPPEDSPSSSSPPPEVTGAPA